MGAAVTQRTVIKPNPRGEEADPIFETELYDIETGERIPKGWKRESCRTGADKFTIPGPEIFAPGLDPQYAPGRPGRYFVPGQLEGRVW